jgi:hypothetical protein
MDYYVIRRKQVEQIIATTKCRTRGERELLYNIFEQLQHCDNTQVIETDAPYYEQIKNIIDDYNKKQIVAFVGRGGSGKDYQSSLLEKRGFVKIAFADALRDITADIVRWPLHELLKIYDDFKVGDVFPGYTGREILENVGAAIRKYDPDFWINAVKLQITQRALNKVCISDMRYINEYFAMQNFCNTHGFEFKCIFCDYHSDRYQEVNSHASAWLSNFFANNNYKDLQEIKEEDIQFALRNFPEEE